MAQAVLNSAPQVKAPAQQRKSRRTMNEMRSIIDGRKLVFQLMREIEKLGLSENVCSSPEFRDKGKQQNNVAQKYIDMLRDGCTPECAEGFASSLTDMLWSLMHSGTPDLDRWEECLKRGKYDGRAPGRGGK